MGLSLGNSRPFYALGLRSMRRDRSIDLALKYFRRMPFDFAALRSGRTVHTWHLQAGSLDCASMPPFETFKRPDIHSTVHLPAGVWASVLDSLCAHFTTIPREQWIDRIVRGKVLDGSGRAITLDTPYREGLRIHYQREVPDEAPIPFIETVVHVDDHLVIADKPHFLPVTPAGSFVEQTLLRRLMHRLGNADLVPLHRIDRATAGLVMFSASRSSRAAYQALFRERRIDKRYEAIAPPLEDLSFPLCRRTRIVVGEPFFRMCEEGGGEPNSETRIDVLERGQDHWRYALFPVTGKKHQLRVHMTALGAPIAGDTLYPVLAEQSPDDYEHPLQLQAQRLAFIDPLTGEPRHFESSQTLGIDASVPGK
jgi:tRNA pseudouridine32 synthase/23S rRNA pseudouridine746 synthase